VIFAVVILALMTWRPQGVVTRRLLRRLIDWRQAAPAEAT